MSLPIFQRTIVDSSGNIQPGASVAVRNETTGYLVTIYADREGGTAKANPFLADSEGFATFYVEPGEYQVTATTTAGTITWSHVAIGDTALLQLAQPTGDALVGSDDGASGSLWTTVAGFIERLRSSAGAALVGFIQSGTGAVSRFVSQKLRETVSPEDFGAVGDGITSDVSALNAAVDHLNANGGGVLRLTPGKTYGIPATGHFSGIRLKSNVYLHMHGAKLKALGANSPDYRLVWIQEQSNCGVVGGEIEGDKLTTTATTDAQGHGVYIILDCNNITVRDVTIKNCYGDGVYTGRLCSNIRILDNNITNNGRNNISVVSSSNVLIDGNEISNANGQSPEAGIDVEPNPGDAVSRNVIITNNRIYGNAQQGIDFPAPPPTPLIENAIVENNHIYNNGGAGIKASYVKHITINANHIYSNGNGGIADSAALATSMTITGNTIYSNTGTAIDGFVSNSVIADNVIGAHLSGFGIRWKFGQNVAITGNTIADAGESGIYYERAYGSVVSGNAITRTQKHGIHITGTVTSSVTRSRQVTIGGNSINSPSLLADNTYHGIFADTFANTCTITGNTVVRASSGNAPATAITSVDSTNLVAGNLVSLGAKSGQPFVSVAGTPTYVTEHLPDVKAPRFYANDFSTFVTSGTGSPEGVLSAGRGSLYMRRDGGAGTSLYVKETVSGNTGWVAK